MAVVCTCPGCAVPPRAHHPRSDHRAGLEPAPVPTGRRDLVVGDLAGRDRRDSDRRGFGCSTTAPRACTRCGWRRTVDLTSALGPSASRSAASACVRRRSRRPPLRGAGSAAVGAPGCAVRRGARPCTAPRRDARWRRGYSLRHDQGRGPDASPARDAAPPRRGRGDGGDGAPAVAAVAASVRARGRRPRPYRRGAGVPGRAARGGAAPEGRTRRGGGPPSPRGPAVGDAGRDPAVEGRRA